MPLSRLSRAGLLAALILPLAVTAAPAQTDTPREGTLRMSGTAEIAARPDRAAITSGVVTQAETAREALDLNSAAIARVISAIKEAGIEDRDIATSGFSIEPRYHYPSGRDNDVGPPRLVGYQVSNQVSVRVRDLDRLGPVLDRVVTAGANRVDGIHFEVSDADKRLDEARAAAVQDARRKAEIYAEAAGVQLRRIVSLSESTLGHQPPRPLMARSMAMDSVEAVPVEAGEQTLTVQVDITWEIGE